MKFVLFSWVNWLHRPVAFHLEVQLLYNNIGESIALSQMKQTDPNWVSFYMKLSMWVNEWLFLSSLETRSELINLL